MIKDTLSNAGKYCGISEGIKKALLYLSEIDEEINDGKYLIDGENFYVNINAYTTKDSADWEVHKKYIDVQFVISGEEKIGICDIALCKDKIPYDKEKDIAFLSGGYGDYITMKSGDFMVIFPEEIHKPGMKINETCKVKKAVIKLAIDY